MKCDQEMRELERSISKSNAPSKTKPVEEPLFRSTGKVGAGMDRAPLAARKMKGLMEDTVEAKTDPRTYIHTLPSSKASGTGSTERDTAVERPVA